MSLKLKHHLAFAAVASVLFTAFLWPKGPGYDPYLGQTTAGLVEEACGWALTLVAVVWSAYIGSSLARTSQETQVLGNWIDIAINQSKTLLEVIREQNAAAVAREDYLSELAVLRARVEDYEHDAACREEADAHYAQQEHERELADDVEESDLIESLEATAMGLDGAMMGIDTLLQAIQSTNERLDLLTSTAAEATPSVLEAAAKAIARIGQFMNEASDLDTNAAQSLWTATAVLEDALQSYKVHPASPVAVTPGEATGAAPANNSLAAGADSSTAESLAGIAAHPSVEVIVRPPVDHGHPDCDYVKPATQGVAPEGIAPGPFGIPGVARVSELVTYARVGIASVLRFREPQTLNEGDEVITQNERAVATILRANGTKEYVVGVLEPWPAVVDAPNIDEFMFPANIK